MVYLIPNPLLYRGPFFCALFIWHVGGLTGGRGGANHTYNSYNISGRKMCVPIYLHYFHTFQRKTHIFPHPVWWSESPKNIYFVGSFVTYQLEKYPVQTTPKFSTNILRKSLVYFHRLISSQTFWSWKYFPPVCASFQPSFFAPWRQPRRLVGRVVGRAVANLHPKTHPTILVGGWRFDPHASF